MRQCLINFFPVSSSVDRVPPAISGCPGDISRTVELGLAGIEVSWVPPTATDISGTVNLQPVARGPGSFFPVAQTPITYRFSDQSGNFVECTFLVIVTTSKNCLICKFFIEIAQKKKYRRISICWFQTTKI